MRTDQGDLCSLVTAQHGNGPFHIVLAAGDLATISHPQQRTGQLTSADLRAMLQAAALWEPRLASLAHLRLEANILALLRPYIQQLSKLLVETSPAYGPLTSRLGQGVIQIKTGLQTNAPWQVTRGVEQLVGLGPGLTPLGDDLLIGILGGLQLATPSIWSEAMVAGFQQGIETKRTTLLSKLWLQHALRGEFSEAWHHVATALTNGTPEQMPRAFAQIAASGATSGLAALSGLYHCWEALAETKTA